MRESWLHSVGASLSVQNCSERPDDTLPSASRPARNPSSALAAHAVARSIGRRFPRVHRHPGAHSRGRSRDRRDEQVTAPEQNRSAIGREHHAGAQWTSPARGGRRLRPVRHAPRAPRRAARLWSPPTPSRSFRCRRPGAPWRGRASALLRSPRILAMNSCRSSAVVLSEICRPIASHPSTARTSDASARWKSPRRA